MLEEGKDCLPYVFVSPILESRDFQNIQELFWKTNESASMYLLELMRIVNDLHDIGCTIDFSTKALSAVITKKYLMSANGKSVLSQQERGLIKVVADSESHRILGAQMMCARATDMISQFGVAIVNGLTLEDVARAIFPHPTFSEGILEAVRD